MKGHVADKDGQFSERLSETSSKYPESASFGVDVEGKTGKNYKSDVQVYPHRTPPYNFVRG